MSKIQYYAPCEYKGENNEHAKRFNVKDGKELYPSEKVVPNLALTVEDILDRFTRGLPLDDQMQGSKPVWPDSVSHDSPDMDKISKMEPQDKLDMARSAVANLHPPVPPVEPEPEHPFTIPKPEKKAKTPKTE